jgi:hypothetical protein
MGGGRGFGFILQRIILGLEFFAFSLFNPGNYTFLYFLFLFDFKLLPPVPYFNFKKNPVPFDFNYFSLRDRGCFRAVENS